MYRPGPDLMALLTLIVLRLRASAKFLHSCLSVECLVTCSMHAHKPKFPAYPLNTLDVSTEFPTSVSGNSLHIVSRAMKLGPDTSDTYKYSLLSVLLKCYVFSLSTRCQVAVRREVNAKREDQVL